jgi:hypothetical protein
MNQISSYSQQDKQLTLAGLVNLKDISCLRVFALHVIMDYAREFVVLRDINLVGTMPASNKVTNLLFYFSISGEYPFDRFFKEDWVGLWGEVVRISAWKPLDLNLEVVSCPAAGYRFLFERMTEKIALLSNNQILIPTGIRILESL